MTLSIEGINAELQRRASALNDGPNAWDASEVIGKDGLDTTTGQAALYSAREVPWHNLGTVTADALTAADALQAAQLDFDVELRPVFAGLSPESVVGGIAVPGRYATIRTDTEAALGIVGARYQPIQNRQAFAFLTDLVADADAKFETAGALDSGRTVFVSMQLPDDIVLDAEGAADLIKIYLMAVNSHDGSSQFITQVTPIRPVCRNTVRWAAEHAVAKWAVRHTSNATERIAEARRALGLTLKYAEEFEAEATELLHAPMSDGQFDEFLRSLFPLDDDASSRLRSNVYARRDVARTLFRQSDTNANIRGTAWAAEQSIIEQLDWMTTVRAPKSLTEDIVRGARIVDGTNDDTKTRVHRQLLELVRR